MQKLRVIQLASFEGNIGDNANHSGTRSMLEKNLGIPLEFTNLEIREFYWKLRKFDFCFAELVNSYDLLMIGGGNYFELWVKDSVTGTSIDMGIDLLKAIKVPILFYGLGCDAGQGIPAGNIQKFRSFLDYILSSNNYLVSVRNDGSLFNIRQYIGEIYASKIHRVPDGGFFAKTIDSFHPEIPMNGKTIGINLAGDMLDIRFPQKDDLGIDYQQFVCEFSAFLNELFAKNDDLSVVFFPHIFRDLNIIADVIINIKDCYRRKRITVAPYLHGNGSSEYIFDIYRKCDLILGMRFHANVCPIGMSVPTGGLACYPQVNLLYNELNLEKCCIQVNKKGFGSELLAFTENSLQNLDVMKNELDIINKQLQVELNSFHGKIKDWLIANKCI